MIDHSHILRFRLHEMKIRIKRNNRYNLIVIHIHALNPLSMGLFFSIGAYFFVRIDKGIFFQSFLRFVAAQLSIRGVTSLKDIFFIQNVKKNWLNIQWVLHLL